MLDATGSGDSTNVANAITWAADHGADVISLSLGGGPDPAMQTAVAYANTKNVVVVAAAGNGGCGTGAVYPAGYSTTEPNLIAVAATDSNGNLAPYSNFGSFVNIAAPGGTGTDPSTAIESTWHDSDTAYATLDGTSMATPFVERGGRAAPGAVLRYQRGTGPRPSGRGWTGGARTVVQAGRRRCGGDRRLLIGEGCPDSRPGRPRRINPDGTGALRTLVLDAPQDLHRPADVG